MGVRGREREGEKERGGEGKGGRGKEIYGKGGMWRKRKKME